MKHIVWILVGVIAVGLLGMALAIGAVAYRAYQVSHHADPFPIADESRLEASAFSDTANGYRIRVPKGWEIDKAPTTGVLHLWRSPVADQVDNREFTPNISVTTDRAGTTDYSAAAIRRHKADHPDFVLLSDRRVIINGVIGHIHDYTYTTKNAWKIHIQQSILPVGSKVYIITGSTHALMIEQHRAQLESSLASFEVIR